MAEFPISKGSRPWPWPWIGTYCIPSCISHRHLPTYRISLKSKKLFADGRTDGRTDGHLRPALLARLGWVELIICKSMHSESHSSIQSTSTCLTLQHWTICQSIKQLTFDQWINYLSVNCTLDISRSIDIVTVCLPSDTDHTAVSTWYTDTTLHDTVQHIQGVLQADRLPA